MRLRSTLLAAALACAAPAHAAWEYQWAGQCNNDLFCASLAVTIHAPDAYAPGTSFACDVRDPACIIPALDVTATLADGRTVAWQMANMLFFRATFPGGDRPGTYVTCGGSCTDFPLMIGDCEFCDSLPPMGGATSFMALRSSGSASAWGDPVYIPEPASAALLLLGLLGVARKIK